MGFFANMKNKCMSMTNMPNICKLKGRSLRKRGTTSLIFWGDLVGKIAQGIQPAKERLTLWSNFGGTSMNHFRVFKWDWESTSLGVVVNPVMNRIAHS